MDYLSTGTGTSCDRSWLDGSSSSQYYSANTPVGKNIESTGQYVNNSQSMTPGASSGGSGGAAPAAPAPEPPKPAPKMGPPAPTKTFREEESLDSFNFLGYASTALSVGVEGSKEALGEKATELLAMGRAAIHTGEDLVMDSGTPGLSRAVGQRLWDIGSESVSLGQKSISSSLILEDLTNIAPKVTLGLDIAIDIGSVVNKGAEFGEMAAISTAIDKGFKWAVQAPLMTSGHPVLGAIGGSTAEFASAKVIRPLARFSHQARRVLEIGPYAGAVHHRMKRITP